MLDTELEIPAVIELSKQIFTDEIRKQNWAIPQEQALFILKRIPKFKYILEFGSGIGYSTFWWTNLVKKNNGMVVSFESNFKRLELAKLNLKSAQLDRYVKFIKGHIPEHINDIKKYSSVKKFDFVFIDIVKQDYLEAFKQCNNYIRQNAVICVDNILTHKQETKDLVDYAYSLRNNKTEIINIGNGILWVTCKCKEYTYEKNVK